MDEQKDKEMESIGHPDEKALRELARLHGMESTYVDGTGRQQVVPAKTLQRFLACMNVAALTSEEIRRALFDVREREWQRLVDEVIVVQGSRRSHAWVVSIPLGSDSLDCLTLRWTIECEDHSIQQGHLVGSSRKPSEARTIKGVRHVRFSLPLPQNLPLGYHWLSVVAETPPRILEGKALMIVAPEQCYLPSHPARAWGVTLQLYGLRSTRNWGVGDFRDLQTLISWIGRDLGAATVGVNPLHAFTRGLISPYSPSSRLFHNPLYLDLEAIDEFRTTPALQRKVRSQRFQAKLQSLRNNPTVQYEEVHAVKWPILEVLYHAFRAKHLRHQTRRADAFKKFTQECGVSLERFAVFQVLQEHFEKEQWRDWPLEFRHPNSHAVLTFQKEHADRIQFYQYLEWQCDVQLRTLCRTANQAGMPFGIYHDLAVGIHPDGADAWVFHDQLAQAVTIGAPPDLFNLAGQNWGLMPAVPSQLRANGYRFFIETIRQNIRHAGVLRIDHALGLFRLFWIPEGGSGKDGAYVYYPVDELLAILALESVRQNVMVIAEDLGAVTPAIRKRLAKGGLLTYRLLLFERSSGGTYRRPDQFPRQALVAVATHDLPTLRGFWMGQDIELKQKLGLYPDPTQAERDRQVRKHEQQALLKALRSERLLPAGCLRNPDTIPELTDELYRAIYAYLARSPSRLLAISLEDLLGDIEAANIPSIPDHLYPVWRTKAGPPGSTIQTWRHNPCIAMMAKTLNRERTRR